MRRRKTYSALSGYVYQYYYEGCRPAVRDRSRGTQYVFQVASGPHREAHHSVFVDDGAIAEWERAHERGLNSTERFAVAKMALFEAFDQRPTPEAAREEVRVGGGAVAPLLSALAID